MSKAGSPETLMLVDGHSVVHRAYHAFPSTLKTSGGETTNAVYGFTRILLAVIKKFAPKYVAVCFDTATPTFRHQRFAPYKKQRPEMEAALVSQLDRVHEVTKTLNIPIFEVPGYEADDVIGTLANQALGLRRGSGELRALGSLIVTDDQDLLQLVGAATLVYMPRKGELWTAAKVCEVYGFPPERMVDYKALRGDPSDNIPGVRGIGPKRALELVERFGSVETIYQRLGEIDPKTQLLLSESAEEAVLSKELVRIVADVPIKLDLEQCRTRSFDLAAVSRLFDALEFRSLLSMLPAPETARDSQMNLL